MAALVTGRRVRAGDQWRSMGWPRIGRSCPWRQGLAVFDVPTASTVTSCSAAPCVAEPACPFEGRQQNTLAVLAGLSTMVIDRQPRVGDLLATYSAVTLGPQVCGALGCLLSKLLPQGTRPIQLAPCGLLPSLFRQGLRTVAQGRAALCTGAKGQGPGAKFNLALVHATALSGTGKQRAAPSGTTRPVSGMAALVQGRPP
jgi:hypothetical protein